MKVKDTGKEGRFSIARLDLPGGRKPAAPWDSFGNPENLSATFIHTHSTLSSDPALMLDSPSRRSCWTAQSGHFPPRQTRAVSWGEKTGFPDSLSAPPRTSRRDRIRRGAGGPWPDPRG